MLMLATLSQGRDQVPYLEIINNVTYKHRVAGDSITRKVDQFYDRVDSGIDVLGKVFGVTKQVRGDESAARGTPEIEAPARKQLGCASPFRIIESCDASTGAETFVVTNGKVKAELPTRALAERVLAEMEAASK